MNTLAELLARPGPVFGTWSQMASPDVLEMLGHAGFDFTVIDCEHAAFGLETAEAMVRSCKAAGITALLRVPTNDRSWIGRALDAGATGIVVPGVESAQEASAAVAAARFAPRGSRGSCPCVRSASHSTANWPAYEETQESLHGAIALVETPAGVEAIDTICAVEGLRAILPGPFDLSVAMGHHGNVLHSDVIAALRRIVTAAISSQLPVVMPVFSADVVEARRQIEAWQALGVRRFLVGTDKILVQDQFRRYRAGIAG